MAAKSICTIPDCDKPHYGRGLCVAHWERWRRHGDPLGGGIQQGEAERYMREVVLTYDGDECLIWPYARDPHGYGVVNVGARRRFVHRIACDDANGPAPTTKHQAAHSCGRGHLGCCAKRHLSWKTRKENEADKLAHGTSNRGTRHGMAKLTEADVLKIRSLRGEKTQRAIAAQFGISPMTVGNIHRRVNWKWLE